VELTDYQFNAHGVEIGYRYETGALVADGATPPPPSRDPQLYYEPTTRSGARLAHAWLERDRQMLSTLDLVDGVRFALLTGVGGEGWAQAAEAAAALTGVPIDTHVIGRRAGILDPYGEWAARREVETSGCVLVRPDRHVAWRAQRLEPGGTDRFIAAFRQVLDAPAAADPSPTGATAVTV
jgi:2,4-dichlorophenol 6-monooxygenase